MKRWRRWYSNDDNFFTPILVWTKIEYSISFEINHKKNNLTNRKCCWFFRCQIETRVFFSSLFFDLHTIPITTDSCYLCTSQHKAKWTSLFRTGYIQTIDFECAIIVKLGVWPSKKLNFFSLHLLIWHHLFI